MLMRRLFYLTLIIFIFYFSLTEAVAVDFGDTIFQDTVLTGDLTGSGIGLIIGADNITLDGQGYSIIGDNSAIGIKLNGRKGVTIKNCIIRNFREGISLSRCENNAMTDNTIKNNVTIGIYVYRSKANSINNNVIQSNNINAHAPGAGIFVYLSTNNVLLNNTVSYNYQGFHGFWSRASQLENNTFAFNDLAAIRLKTSSDTEVINNIFDSNKAGVSCDIGSGHNIINNSINNCQGAGIGIRNSGNVLIKENQINSNKIGIYLDIINDFVIEKNTITLNTDEGIYAYTGVRSVLLTQNTISQNSYGLKAHYDFFYWTIYHNNIYQNDTYNIYGGSILHDNEISYDSEGNYWGRDCPEPLFIPGEDSNSQRIVDSYPYRIKDAWLYGLKPGCPPPVSATIDIGPGTLNLKGKGKWITCYIELPSDYDAEDIDAASISIIKIGSNEITPINSEPHPVQIGDYDNDGIADLMVKFNCSNLQEMIVYNYDSISITVSGDINGLQFEGTDAIRTIHGMTPPIAAPNSDNALNKNLHDQGKKTVICNNMIHPNKNSEVSLFYTLKEEDNISIKVVNVLGELVKVLINENQPSGDHSVNWDGTNSERNKVSSGLYFIKISSSAINETRKVVVIR